MSLLGLLSPGNHVRPRKAGSGERNHINNRRDATNCRLEPELRHHRATADPVISDFGAIVGSHSSSAYRAWDRNAVSFGERLSQCTVIFN